MILEEALILLCHWHERAARAERDLNQISSKLLVELVGIKVRSLKGAKPYGHIVGWDKVLRMIVIRWDGTADHGPEACEPHEFEIIT